METGAVHLIAQPVVPGVGSGGQPERGRETGVGDHRAGCPLALAQGVGQVVGGPDRVGLIDRGEGGGPGVHDRDREEVRLGCNGDHAVLARQWRPGPQEGGRGAVGPGQREVTGAGTGWTQQSK